MFDPVFLYGDKVGKLDYVDHMGTDLTIVNSARVSFGKEKSELNDKDKKLISYLVNHRHTSTFEHNIVTFRCKVPLFVRSQHHRHRTWSYNEISRRYTSIDMQFYEPKSFRTQHESNRQSSKDELINPDLSALRKTIHPVPSYTASQAIKDHNSKSLNLYNSLIENGVCREQARGVLPQNLYTEYYATCNLNNLFKFIELRTHDGAQWEIRQLASAMLDIATNLWPIAVESYRKNKSGRS
jgi:thymidylate synthase (FAD)